MQQKTYERALSGFGLGLRAPHYEEVLITRPAADWFEVVSENFMEAHAGHLEYLADLRVHYPLVLHGVGLSIGGTDALNADYLRKLAALAEIAKPAVISDHLCFTGTHGVNSHDLLPVPYTSEALAHISDRVKRVQDFLGQRIALENPSSYVEFHASHMTEWDFLNALAVQADCLLVLDVNNVYVSARNHGWNAHAYIDAVMTERIAYMHLAGHRNFGTHIVDTHDSHVVQNVWDLYAHTVRRHGNVPCMIEWDGNIPEFSVLLAELGNARAVAKAAA